MTSKRPCHLQRKEIQVGIRHSDSSIQIRTKVAFSIKLEKDSMRKASQFDNRVGSCCVIQPDKC